MSVSVHPPFTYEFTSKYNRRSLPPAQPTTPQPQNKRLSCLAPSIPDRSSSLVYLPDFFNNTRSEPSTPIANITSPPLSKASAAAGRPDMMIPLCEIPEELDQELGSSTSSSTSSSLSSTHESSTWHNHAAELKKLMATVLEQNRMLAEQLVDAERRARMWQTRCTETQDKLSAATEEYHTVEQELDATRRMLKESEHVRNHWSLKMPPVEETAEPRNESIKTVEPEPSSSTSIPTNFIRFIKKTPQKE